MSIHLRSPLHIIILAAGKGTRMRSQLPKVMHDLGGEPILGHVIKTAKSMQHARVHVVIAPDELAVSKFARECGCTIVVQPQPDGTASAALAGLGRVPANGVALVLFGDLPLLRAGALRKLVAVARRGGLALRTMEPPAPAGYGRVLRDDNGRMVGLVTHHVASTAQRRLREVDAGGMAFPVAWGKQALAQVKPQSIDSEKPLTELVARAFRDGMTTSTVKVDVEEGMGVNTPGQLMVAQACVSRTMVERLAEQGILFAAPETVAIHGKLSARPGAYVERNVMFRGKVSLAADSMVGPNCVIDDTVVGSGARIHAFSHVVGATLGKDAQVGPFARLRPGTRLAEGAKVGNFVEVKATRLGAGSKANHLAYLGDGEIGADVNIGAGTVLCNYDGVDKHQTKIGAGVFVGSGTMLVAPVELGEGSMVAAGSVIIKDVPAGQVGIARGQQRNMSKRKTRRKKSA